MATSEEWFAQLPYRVRLEWGRRGARVAASRGDVLIVVDALCFSTTTAIAVARGATVHPCAKGEDTPEFARTVGDAEIAVHRDHVPQAGRFSLSPVTMHTATPGTRIVLASPNGATCARYGASVPALYAGAFVNARAVAETVAQQLTEDPRLDLTVLACGERWLTPDADDGDLRFALEDYLAAGAILSYLPASLTRSPEAMAATTAFSGIRAIVLQTLRDCGSGIELIDRGYGEDVTEAAALNTLSAVPILSKGAFTAIQAC